MSILPTMSSGPSSPEMCQDLSLLPPLGLSNLDPWVGGSCTWATKSGTSVFLQGKHTEGGPRTSPLLQLDPSLFPGHPPWRGEMSNYHPGPSLHPQISFLDVSLILLVSLPCSLKTTFSQPSRLCHELTTLVLPLLMTLRGHFGGVYWPLIKKKKFCHWKKKSCFNWLVFFAYHLGCHKAQLIPMPWKKAWTRKCWGGIWKSGSNCWR